MSDERTGPKAPGLDRSDPLDPRGLISEAFRMEGVTEPDCRSIFFDWALGLPDGADAAALVKALLERHSGEPADHPMQTVLREGLTPRADRGARGRRRRKTAEDGGSTA